MNKQTHLKIEIGKDINKLLFHLYYRFKYESPNYKTFFFLVTKEIILLNKNGLKNYSEFFVYNGLIVQYF